MSDTESLEELTPIALFFRALDDYETLARDHSVSDVLKNRATGFIQHHREIANSESIDSAMAYDAINDCYNEARSLYKLQDQKFKRRYQHIVKHFFAAKKHVVDKTLHWREPNGDITEHVDWSV